MCVSSGNGIDDGPPVGPLSIRAALITRTKFPLDWKSFRDACILDRAADRGMKSFIQRRRRPSRSTFWEKASGFLCSSRRGQSRVKIPSNEGTRSNGASKVSEVLARFPPENLLRAERRTVRRG